jgi:hypothetical protein
LPDKTSRPHRGDRVRFSVQAFQGKRRVGKGSVTAGYGRTAQVTMLVSDSPLLANPGAGAFRDGIGKSDEKIFLGPSFAAKLDGADSLPAATGYEFDNGDGASITDTSPCEELSTVDFDACAPSPLYSSGGKRTASVQVNYEDGSALCDKLNVNVRTAPLSLELDVTTTPNRSVFVPGDPKSGNPRLRVRVRNTTSTSIANGYILFTGNLLTCETEAKVGGTTLTRTTQIDLQHCSSTVSQACGDDSDCQAEACPTCQPG